MSNQDDCVASPLCQKGEVKELFSPLFPIPFKFLFFSRFFFGLFRCHGSTRLRNCLRKNCSCNQTKNCARCVNYLNLLILIWKKKWCKHLGAKWYKSLTIWFKMQFPLKNLSTWAYISLYFHVKRMRFSCLNFQNCFYGG